MITNLNVNLEVEQEILVEKNNAKAKITKIEFQPKQWEESRKKNKGHGQDLTVR